MNKAREEIITATVNSPFKSYMGVELIVDALQNCKPNYSQIYSFFTEISVEDQRDFARSNGISESKLIESAELISHLAGYEMPICKNRPSN